jgi:hypothetical protein
METPEKFDQTAMDRVTDKVLAFRPKKVKAEKKQEPGDGATTQQSGRSK